MENCLPFTDDVMVVLVHKCVQQAHLLALHLETLGYFPRILIALNGLEYFLIIGDQRGDNLMVGSQLPKLLTELLIQTEDAECNLMGEMCNFANLVFIIKVVWVSTIPRPTINTPVIKMIQPVLLCVLQRKGRYNKCSRQYKWLIQVHRGKENISYTTGYENRSSSDLNAVHDIEDIQEKE